MSNNMCRNWLFAWVCITGSLVPIRLPLRPLWTHGRIGASMIGWPGQLDRWPSTWAALKQPWFGSHRIHVWYIYLHLVDLYGKCRWIYHTWILWGCFIHFFLGGMIVISQYKDRMMSCQGFVSTAHYGNDICPRCKTTRQGELYLFDS